MARPDGKPLEIHTRAFDFSVRIVKPVQALPKDTAGFALGKQVCRSGTSIGANAEEARAAHTRKEFVRRLSIARAEARETLYWLRLIRESGMVKPSRLTKLIQESDELIRILTAAVKTAQQRET